MNAQQNPTYPEKSIAVLPFVNMSADPENEYFCDGITEEILNALTKVQGLKVTARTSSFAFKNRHIDVRTIGEQLGVATVLEGSVRKARNNVRITAQLIQTKDGFHLWSKNFNRELQDIFAVQDEISLLIADQIRENFGHLEIQEHLIDAPTQNIEAYNLYLKGRYHHLKWNSEGIRTGIELYKQSIALDPDFALPYFGIAYSLAMRASWGSDESFLRMAEDFVKRGFEIDDHAYLGFYAQGTVSFWGKWDFKTGQRFYTKAIELNPSFTEAEEGLAELYTAIGDFDKAMYHTRNILALNPLSPNHYYTKGVIHFLTRDYRQALESMEAALRVDPNFSFAIELTLLCYILLKELAQFEDFLRMHPQAEMPDVCRALYKLMYPDEPVQVDLSAARSNVPEAVTRSLLPWQLYLQVYLGNHELALNMLENGVQKRTGQFVNFKNIPLLEPLHHYERFQHLVQNTFQPPNLPDAGEEGTVSVSVKALFSEPEVAQYLDALSNALDQEQLYLDPDLSLKALANKLGLHPNRLSWLLNEHIGKNFNEYINAYRLEAFKIKALDPANAHLTILGLAYESGFNSKTVFNTFFKKMEGTTPRAWLKATK